MSPAAGIVENLPLAPHTTLGVGGPARYWLSLPNVEAVSEALAFAARNGVSIHVLGGGSNTLVADAGVDALVLSLTDDRITFDPSDAETVEVQASAGVEWDPLVAATVEAGLSGIECLSGIPGWVGAAPIQNIGAYGQELAETIASVDVVDLATGERQRIGADDCGFGYRHSHFKAAWRGRFLVASIRLRLTRTVAGVVRYGQVRKRLAVEDPTPAQVRDTVLAIRSEKSMVLRNGDPNRRSAGSFFVNPVVDIAAAEAAEERYRRKGGLRPMPRYPVDSASVVEQVKLSAAWLIEEAGFARGFVHESGTVGLSSRHTLALINRGDATAADIIALAGTIRRGVRDAFDIALHPEPVFVGFDQTTDQLLA